MKKLALLAFSMIFSVAVFATEFTGTFKSDKNSITLHQDEGMVFGSITLNGVEYKLNGKMKDGHAYVDIVSKGNELFSHAELYFENGELKMSLADFKAAEAKGVAVRTTFVK